ncbi:skeletal muscle/kidney enriched inositol 5-phosphatase [Laetiporus sulphureus 93-53]|uniref:Skeletal muscle/kidney enriched inositol 5-phosphatase n=1 Tax=Laetiporus sulphureus 93-53 TaxID=1314785 RepID=A0A165G0F1_9APHY|nr:skeletal muscle/kidney enriched inositol 5-phosphatase [Laetiporus sulphureus 93-53]KZT09661.1 skeletal muscle/kidney enriched inositol 5-phosphatase [Laetiporus sulphureus 93-53]
MSEDRLLVQIASYNTNLQADSGLPQDLVDWLSPTLEASTPRAAEVTHRAPDIVAVGFQELLPLHLGFAGLSSSVIDSRNALILSQIEAHAPNKERYSLIAKEVNVGVALLVYGLDEGVARTVCDVETQWTGCGPAYMGNKGAVGVRFRVPSEDDGLGEVYTFVCAHLTAHACNLHRRVQDYHHIVGTLLFPPLPSSSSSTSSSAPTTIYASSHLFFFGDLNFRLRIPPTHRLAALSPADLAHALSDESTRRELAEYDELSVERDVNQSAFACLREGEFWRFMCSYKYKLGEIHEFDLKRLPAWTDRIMYATYTDSSDNSEESHISNLLYTTVPSYTTSDHKPIVTLLLLPPPPPLPSPQSPTPPTLRLPPTYTPRPDPYAPLKRYTGRVLGRLVGYCWCLLVFIGAGSAALGVGNFVLGLGVWGWWRWRGQQDGSQAV